MQKSYKNMKNNNSQSEPPSAPPCPRCGSVDTHLSLKKLRDGLLKIVFCKFYRCHECRYRFWIIGRTRMYLFIGMLMVMLPIVGVVYVLASQQAALNESVQVADDATKTQADQGNSEAELQMGLRYSSPAWGVEDDKVAAKWFAKAALQNQPEAQYRYGIALLKGIGVVQDYKKAMDWLEKSAQQGNAQAQLALGEMYQAGVGTDSNAEKAYLWFNLAAAQGLDKAASARDLVVKLLTAKQITTMQEEAVRISQSGAIPPDPKGAEATPAKLPSADAKPAVPKAPPKK